MKVFRKRKQQRGFTLIELMIVIAIIGILAAIAIPQFQAYRIKGYETAARLDAKNAYTAAQSYFSENPSGTVTLALLASNGFKSSPDVTTTIANGTMASLSMTTANSNGGRVFTIDSTGAITP